MDKTVIDTINRITPKVLPDLVKFLRDIIRIKSLPRAEGDVIDRIHKEMLDLQFDSVRVDGMGNLIGKIGSGDKILCFDGHADVVEPGDMQKWDSDPFSGEIHGGKIWGRGTVDQKGGVAAMIYAIKIWRELGLLDQVQIIVTVTVNEEDCEGANWHYLYNVEQIKPDMVVITEPSELKIMRGHRGRALAEIKTSGITAHGSQPENGDNAIYKMASIVDKLRKLNDNLLTDNLFGKGSLTVSKITSKAPSDCSVPDECSILIDRRTNSIETKELLLNQFKEIATDLDLDIEANIDHYDKPSYTGLVYPREQFFPAWEVNEDHICIQSMVKAYENLFDSQPHVGTWGFCTNATAICGDFGIPCVGFGPGNIHLAHAYNEHLEIDQLEKSFMVYGAMPAAYIDLL